MTSFCAFVSNLTLVTVKKADLFAELPESAKHLIGKKRSNGRDHVIYRGEYMAEFQLSADAIQRGISRALRIPAILKGQPNKEAEKACAEGRKLCLISAEVDEYDGSNLPVDVAWRLDIVTPFDDVKSAPLSNKVPFDPARHVAHSFIAEARQKWRAEKAAARKALMMEALVYEDPQLEVPGPAGVVLHRPGNPGRSRQLPDGRFFIPLAYRYSGLISNVHRCIVLANAYKHNNVLFASTLPSAAYMLPASREGFEIMGDDLSNAIEFIEKRLLPALVAFSPNALTFTVTPFGVARWVDEWAQHVTARDNSASLTMPVTGQMPDQIKCTLRVVCHFVELEQQMGISVSAAAGDGERRTYILPDGISAMADVPVESKVLQKQDDDGEQSAESVK